MKHNLLIALFAVMAGVLAFSSCEPNSPESKSDNDFVITVSEVKATSAYVQVVPKDASSTYVLRVFDAGTYKEFQSEAAVIASVKQSIDQTIAAYKQSSGKTYTYADFLSKGEQKGTISPLSPETEFVLAVFNVNKDFTETGKVNTASFTTEELVVEQQISLNMPGTIEHFKDPKSGNDRYQAWAALNADTTAFFCLCPYSSEIEGTFTEKDLDPMYTALVLAKDGKRTSFNLHKANYSVTYNTSSDRYEVAGTALFYNGLEITFVLSCKKTEPKGAPQRRALSATAKPSDSWFISQ